VRVRHYRGRTDRARKPCPRSGRPDRHPAGSRASRTVVKATQRDFAGTAPKAARQCKMFFFCGQDEAGAAAAAERLTQMLENPGDRVELPGSELKRDPVRLRSEERRVGKERRKRWSRGRGNG